MIFSHPLTFVVVLLATGLIAAAVVVRLMTKLLLTPPRMTDGKAVYVLHRLSPGDLGLHFSDEKFSVRDAATGQPLNIAGWWIPAAVDLGKCFVLLHGYADAKVGVIAWAPLFHKLGYHVLAIDLRAHGESGGRYSTGGVFERDDVDQVLNQLRQSRPEQTQQLFLFGASLGAATAVLVAAIRHDLSAVILDSPFTDYPTAVAAHARRSGLPGGLFLWLSLKLGEFFSGANFTRLRPVHAIEHADCPVFLILSEKDELLGPSDFQRFKTAIECNPRGEIWIVSNAAHVSALLQSPEEYADKVAGFLNRAGPSC